MGTSRTPKRMDGDVTRGTGYQTLSVGPHPRTLTRSGGALGELKVLTTHGGDPLTPGTTAFERRLRRRHRILGEVSEGAVEAPFDYDCAFAAALKRSGVNGTVRIRTPVASKTALEIADGTTAADGSPTPHGGSAGRLISSDSTTGTSG